MRTVKVGIIAGGNFITDYVKVVDAWPEQDTLASIRSESMSNGGGPYNLLKDLARLDPALPLEACGLVGEDANGDWVLADCEEVGIDVTQLRKIGDAATSYTDAITVAATGRRTFFHQRGANALLSPEHFDFDTSRAKIFALGYLMLLDGLDQIDADGEAGATKVLRAAREAGMVTAVDCVSEPGPRFRDVVLSAMREADLLFINEFEIGQVIDREVPGEQGALVAAATTLAAEFPRAGCQVVLHAAGGAVAAMADGSWVAHASVALPESEIAGATGAGDAFAAGYLLGVHREEDAKSCLRNAVCAAAVSLVDPTPSAGMRGLSECLELGERYGFRNF
jgi:sugar/nucleoside kinase (ribokinase family)